MQEVFEKIIDKLEDRKYANRHTFHNDEWNVGIDQAIGIVKQVAVEVEQNNGWIQADEPPKDDNYVLLSFKNFDIPMVGRYIADGEGRGAYYLGDCEEEETCTAIDLFVNAWQKLTQRYNPDVEKQEKKMKYDLIRSMCLDEMASFLSDVKYDGIYYNEGMEYPIISEVWKDWLQSEVEE